MISFKRPYHPLFGLQLLLLVGIGLLQANHLEDKTLLVNAVTVDPAVASRQALVQTVPETLGATVGSLASQSFQVDTAGLTLAHISLKFSYPLALVTPQLATSVDPVCAQTLRQSSQGGVLALSCDIERPIRQPQILNLFQVSYQTLASGSAMIRLLPEQSTAVTADGGPVSLRPQDGIITLIP